MIIGLVALIFLAVEFTIWAIEVSALMLIAFGRFVAWGIGRVTR